MPDRYNLIVVGAGWSGLAVAKTYLELHPAKDILVIEAENSIGGTWAASRLYPGLKTNNLLDQYEYPDFPMSPDRYNVKPGEHIPGSVVHQYLTDFAKKFGIYVRTKFNTKVESLQAGEKGGWVLNAKGADGKQQFHTGKVVIATGLTSQPNVPSFPGEGTFDGPAFHAKDFCRRADTVEKAQNVVIVGGAKSAMDVAYAYAVAGAHVDLVIRPSGKGPLWISYPWVMGGAKRLEKLLGTRYLTWFSPCTFGGVDGWGWVRNFLHGTAVGRFVVKKFWGALGGEVLEKDGYASHRELKKLQPWHSAFWTASSLSILNYDVDLFGMVKQGKVHVHIADVERLSKHTVHLNGGTQITADALIYATGWRKAPSLKFDDVDIGLPFEPAEQANLVAEADRTILNKYPSLKDQPTVRAKVDADPYRLYRFIVPPSKVQDRNIAFAGMVSSVLQSMNATVQAIWISAFFDNKLDILPVKTEDIVKEAVLNSRWGRWRYPCGYGAEVPDLAFDALPYIDVLMKDLGLEVKRKRGWWWNDVVEPYGPEDFRDLIDEWSGGHQQDAQRATS